MSRLNLTKIPNQTPSPVGKISIYVKNNGNVYIQDENGIESQLLTGTNSTPNGNSLPVVIPPAGSLFYNTTNFTLYASSGTQWIPVNSGAPTGTALPLPTPVSGSLFYNNTTLQLNVSDGVNWIPVTLNATVPVGTLAPVPVGPVGSLFYNTGLQQLLVSTGVTYLGVGPIQHRSIRSLIPT
jgi:hypothetical protein